MNQITNFGMDLLIEQYRRLLETNLTSTLTVRVMLVVFINCKRDYVILAENVEPIRNTKFFLSLHCSICQFFISNKICCF